MALVNAGYLHYADMKKFLTIFFSEITGQILKQFHRDVLGGPFSKIVLEFKSIKKHGSSEWGLLAIYRHEEILKNSSSLKRQVRF